MNRFQSLLKLKIITVLMVGLLSGCQSFYSVFPPSTDFNFKVAKHVNPDMDGRPSPVVVKVYELASRTRFSNQDFFVLYDAPESVLGVDLLRKEELEFEPGDRFEYNMALSPAARYVAVVVAYRDIEQARWKAVVEVDPTDYDSFYVYMDELAVYIREHDLDINRNDTPETQTADLPSESDLNDLPSQSDAGNLTTKPTVKDATTEAEALLKGNS